MKRISVMLKPASSLCNLRCRYCFYAEVSDSREIRSFGVMERETASRILENIFSCLTPGDELNLAFQGGEPTLAGLDFFRFFVSQVERLRGRLRVSYALQTNGTLLDEEWCAFFREHDFLIGLSLDATQAMHDQNRVDASGKGTYTRVSAARALLEKQGVAYNVLSVLTNALARHPQQVWSWLCKDDIRYVQFIPCLGELDGGATRFSLSPERFASFYTQLFKLWNADFEKGRYRSVKLFDDLVKLLVDGSRNACGLTGRCMPQIVVEADGSVYPCDFYALDAYRVGNLAEAPIDALYTSAAMAAFRTRPTAMPALCGDCPYAPVCGGGCPRMRREVCGTPEAKSCGYRSFLDQCLPELHRIALREREARSRAERYR